MQRLAIAGYISSVFLDLLPRQDDPLPMAAFVLRSMSPFHDALKPNNVAQFPSPPLSCFICRTADQLKTKKEYKTVDSEFMV